MKAILFTFIAIFALVPDLSPASALPKLELKEIKRWSFFRYVSLYASSGTLVIHGSNDEISRLTLYSLASQKEQTIPLPSGEGPGELVMLKGAVIASDSLFLWDAKPRRLSRFGLESGRFMDARPFTAINVFSKLIALKSDDPVFAVSRSQQEGDKRGFLQRIEGLDKEPTAIMPPTFFTPEKVWALEVPLMLSAGSQTHIALADSMKYRITLRPFDGSAPVIIEQKTITIPWTKTIQNRFDLFEKGQKEEMAKHPRPKAVHPLFAISLSEKHLAVCRNDRIAEEKALIDFYSLDGTLLGQAVIPANVSQYAANLPMQYSLSFSLVDDSHLASLHYDHETEMYVVALYRLTI